MVTSFTDWNPYELEHHGIRGMKWGVRKYQNEDGSLTAAGKARYANYVDEGGHTHLAKGASARKMTKDLNALDEGYAKVAQRQQHHATETARYERKAKHARYKGNEAKYNKLHAKAMDNAKKASEANTQKKSIENLQWRIMATAARKGYSVNSKPVERLSNTGKQVAAYLVGGAAGAIAYSQIAKARGTNVTVSGQQFKVSKRGDGKINVVNYRAANSAAAVREHQHDELKKYYGARR